LETRISIRSILHWVRGLVLLALVLAGFTLHFWYWYEIDARGTTISCPVSSKHERIQHRTRDDGWSPVFHVELACRWSEPGAPLSQPAFDTDEAEFDRIQPGTPFEVRYLPDVPMPLFLVGINGAHLARETIAIHIGRAFATLGPLLAIGGYLLLIVFFGWLISKRKGRGVMWIFFGLLAGAFIYVLTPTLPLVISGRTAHATATIKEMQAHTRILTSRKSSGINASTPYELVVLEYVPSGRRESVLAADMIDIASQPTLTVGQQVAIDYEVDHPRRANITGATREYYHDNVIGAILVGFATIALFVGGTLAWEAIKRRGKRALDEARERARDRAL
jgi:hypothetical protein